MLRKLPKNFKYLKTHVNLLHKNRNDIAYSFMLKYIYGLYILNDSIVTYSEIFSFLKQLKKKLKKKFKFNLNIAFTVPVTKKASGIRMGKGKGPQKDWVCLVNKGQVLIEICILDQLDLIDLKYVYKEAISKLSFKTKLIKINF